MYSPACAATGVPRRGDLVLMVYLYMFICASKFRVRIAVILHVFLMVHLFFRASGIVLYVFVFRCFAVVVSYYIGVYSALVGVFCAVWLFMYIGCGCTCGYW